MPLLPGRRVYLSHFDLFPASASLRPKTRYTTRTPRPHHTTFQHIEWCHREKSGVVWCGVVSVSVCLVFGRRLALVGQHRDDGGSHVYTRSSAIADGPRDATFRSNSCQLLHSSVGTTCTTSPDQICAGQTDRHGAIAYTALAWRRAVKRLGLFGHSPL